MQPNRLGRVLGIGARVAAGKLRDGTAGAVAAVQRSSTQAAPASAVPQTTAPTKPGRTVPSVSAVGEKGRRYARGAGRFGATLLRPFAHATGILTLQITGVFFALFGVFFVVHSWQLYRAAGWRDHHLALYAVLALLFCWFAISSFWRANRKQKRT